MIPIFERQLTGLAESVSEGTIDGFITGEVLPENPLAEYSTELITNEQRKKAVESISEKLRSGELVIPAALPNFSSGARPVIFHLLFT